METENNSNSNFNRLNHDPGNEKKVSVPESVNSLTGSTVLPSLDTNSSQLELIQKTFDAINLNLKRIQATLDSHTLLLEEHSTKINFTYECANNLETRIISLENAYSKPKNKGKFAISSKNPETSSLRAQLKNISSIAPKVNVDGFPLFTEQIQQKHKEVTELKKKLRSIKKSKIDPTKPARKDPLEHIKGRTSTVPDLCFFQQTAIKTNNNEIACPIHMSISGACSHSLSKCSTISNWNLAIQGKNKFCIYHKSHNHYSADCNFLKFKCSKHNEQHHLGDCPTLWRLILSKERGSH